MPAYSRVRILWLDIDNVPFEEAEDRIVDMCRDPGPAYVVTPNVDHFMRVRKNQLLRAIYSKAALCLADGMPILWASKLLGRPLKAKVSGSDLVERLCKRASEEGLRLFLLGGAPGVIEQARRVLERRLPGIQIVGTRCPMVNADGIGADDDETIAAIREAKPHLLFVAFGCPKQELWIARNGDPLGVPVSMGIGASLDFIAGITVRAPRWMQQGGLNGCGDWRTSRDGCGDDT